jgi:hypothetical protein
MQPLATAIAVIAFAAGLEHVALIGGFAIEIGPAYVACLRDFFDLQTGGVPIALPREGFLSLAVMHPDACLLGAAAFARRTPSIDR